jgi:hypothetical protein
MSFGTASSEIPQFQTSKIAEIEILQLCEWIGGKASFPILL